MSTNIEKLLDEAFAKHHSTQILDRPFKPEQIKSNGARVKGRFTALGLIAAAAAIVAFALLIPLIYLSTIPQLASDDSVDDGLHMSKSTTEVSGDYDIYGLYHDYAVNYQTQKPSSFDYNYMPDLTGKIHLSVAEGDLMGSHTHISDGRYYSDGIIIVNISGSGEVRQNERGLNVLHTEAEVIYSITDKNAELHKKTRIDLAVHLSRVPENIRFEEGRRMLVMVEKWEDGVFSPVLGFDSCFYINDSEATCNDINMTVTSLTDTLVCAKYDGLPLYAAVYDMLNGKDIFEKDTDSLSPKSDEASVIDDLYESKQDTSDSSVTNNVSSKEEKPEEYAELEMHTSEKPVYTFDEADRIINKGVIEYEREGRKIVDTEKYIRGIKDGTIDKNSLEGKSYIYHMMLNSIDHFSSAEGSMTYAFDSEPSEIVFQTDMDKGTSYEYISGEKAYEYYISGQTGYTVDIQTKTYSTQNYGEPVEYTLSDNDRLVTVTDDTGEQSLLSNKRNDLTNLRIAGNSCLFPQAYPIKYLFDFNCWSVVEITEKLGRECVYIEGNASGQAFNMTIDLKTGIMLECNKLDASGNVTGYVRTNDIKIDEDIEVKTFDENKLS